MPSRRYDAPSGPQTRRGRTTYKGNAEVETGKGEGKWKRRRGRLKESATPRTTQTRKGRETTGEMEANLAGDKTKPEPSEDGEGTAGDVTGYHTTLEDLCLREVYGDWVHAKPGTHLDGGNKDDSAWQA